MIQKAFSIGILHLGNEKGILMQVFDMSHFNPWNNYYDLADRQCDGNSLPISQMFTGIHPAMFTNQIRMLMSNRYTLNPFSSLIIRRYDVVDAQLIRTYENDLREFIRALNPDQEQVEQYRKELFASWEVSDDQVS